MTRPISLAARTTSLLRLASSRTSSRAAAAAAASFNLSHHITTMAIGSFPLNTGANIPAVGLGTWQSKRGEVKEAVEVALKHGYRLIDAAYCYGNEVEVGQGIRAAMDSGVDRKDIFVVTKVWATYNTRVEEGLKKSLENLGLDYVDLFLVHWPLLMNPNGNDDKFPTLPNGARDIIHGWSHVEAWKQMEAVFKTGKTKAIGVCNYSKQYLEELLPHCQVLPAVNQIENHPSLPQQEVFDLCREKGIHIMAYSPLGSTGSPLFTVEPVVRIAEKRRISPVTVLLSYHVARGSTVLPKSVTPSRIKSNFHVVRLDEDEMKLLNDYSDKLTRESKLRRYVYPPFGVDFGFPDKARK